MADGCHFEKKYKKFFVCICLSDFDEIWHDDASGPYSAEHR